MPWYYEYLIFYLIIISLISVFTTVYDKQAAKRHKRRVPEKNLILLSALGGSASMLVTMLIIRHKTKHLKFMLGIPFIIFLQTALSVSVFILTRWI